MSRQFTTDYYTDVNFGLVNGRSMVGVVGQSDFISTAFKDIWGVDGDHTIATSAETLEVVSSSANDTSAGSGIRTVLITSLDASWVEQTQLVTMNGTSAVALTGTHRAVNIFVSSTTGTVGKGGVAAGDITLRVASAGATRGVIRTGLNSSFSSFYTVPASKEALWIQSAVFAQKGEDIQIRSRFRIGESGICNMGGNAPLYQNSVVYEFKTGLVLPAKSMYFSEAKAANVGPSTVTSVAEFIVRDV